MDDDTMLDGVSEQQILKEYMDKNDFYYESITQRIAVTQSNSYQLHLSLVRFNEALTNLWGSMPWWKRIVCKINLCINTIKIHKYDN